MKITKSLLVSFILLSGVSTSGVHAETVAQALKKCGQVQNSLKRLVCYDQIVNNMNRYGDLDELMQVRAPLSASGVAQQSSSATNSQAPTEAAVAPVAKAPQATANDDFGMEYKTIRENAQDKIYATIVKIETNARKKRVFTLDNGHVWRETEGSSFKVDNNDLIYIERGAIGSFHLSKDDVNRRIRVKRVK
ncbi:hypothetical protein [Aliiglaciecola litoralis]|uniref:Uncharacterized protein n=1 Tax=Aliiglaciecola litoralis TaxID=582857 RepID=A0ABN1LET6_9ALTE